MLRALLTLCVLFASGAVAAKVKPVSEYFHVCHRNQSNELLASCIKTTLETAKPLFVQGIPELGLVSIDPLRIEKIEMKENNGRFKLSQTLTNLSIYGLGNYVVKNVSVDIESLSLNITSWVEKMRFEGAYEIDGQVMVLPVRGSGHATYNFTGVTTSGIIKLKEYKKNKKDYLKLDSYKMTIEPAGARSHFTNLFNGDKRLGDATNAFLNENWYEAFTTYRQLPEEAFAKFLANLAGRVFAAFTADELFPE